VVGECCAWLGVARYGCGSDGKAVGVRGTDLISMKRLKLSYLLILIVPGLFLIGANENEKHKARPNISSISKTEQPENTKAQKTEAQKKQPAETPTADRPLITISPPRSQPEEKSSEEDAQDPWYRSWSHWFSRLLSASDLPNWIVIVGWGIAALIAFFTLAAIMRQANITSRQVALVANLERPWLIARPGDLNHWQLATAHRQSGATFRVEVNWSATNSGRSPAFLTNLFAALTFCSFPVPNERPDYPTYEPFAQLVISQGESHGSELILEVSDVDVQRMRAHECCILFYGRFEYNDSLQRPHLTRFCSYWRSHDNPTLYPYSLIFQPVGPPSYIEYT